MHPQTRNGELERIRQTYRRYETTGRTRLWDPANPGFARAAGDARRAVADLVKASVPSSGSVLDLGCGDGMLAEEVRVRGSALQWTGVDLRSEAVARAAGLHPWATFLEAPADDLPFKQSAFDVVVCSVLFSSLPSRSMERNVAQEITRVLRPGGWLVWYDLRYSNPANPEVHAVTQRRLAELFNGWHSELRLLTLLPPVTRRLGRLTAIAYPALHLFPPLRSHLLGRLQRPT